jgi:hypothetical protein
MELNMRETSNPMLFPGVSGGENALPSMICKFYVLGWWKSPLGREGGRGEEKGGGGGENE